jgi:hypothetical protein
MGCVPIAVAVMIRPRVGAAPDRSISTSADLAVWVGPSMNAPPQDTYSFFWLARYSMPEQSV